MARFKTVLVQKTRLNVTEYDRKREDSEIWHVQHDICNR